ncbi:hypothetical protein C2S52_000019 [Perilla frutescens var. hirtella]|nr:hypothetical protein C2S52_000019 [Perilla frutescens var. hirtella]
MAACSGDTSGSQVSGHSSSKSRRKVCDKHNRAELFMSRTDANPFRRFVKCPERVRGCTFFDWVDDPMPDYQTMWVERLKMQKESLEDQVEGKMAMVNNLSERIELKEHEILLLRGKCAELEAMVKQCHRNSGLMKGLIALGVFGLLFVIVLVVVMKL